MTDVTVVVFPADEARWTYQSRFVKTVRPGQDGQYQMSGLPPYDRYLVAMGESNRVRVEDVLQESPAAQVGVQPGDLIVRYADARVFALDELVNATRGRDLAKAEPGGVAQDQRLPLARADLRQQLALLERFAEVFHIPPLPVAVPA
jgi:S1-C subfamily serine protease